MADTVIGFSAIGSAGRVVPIKAVDTGGGVYALSVSGLDPLAGITFSLRLQPNIGTYQDASCTTLASVGDNVDGYRDEKTGNLYVFKQLGAQNTPVLSNSAFGGNKSLHCDGASALALLNSDAPGLATMQAGSFTISLLIQLTDNTHDLQTIFAKGGGESELIWYMGRTNLRAVSGEWFQSYLTAQATNPGRNTEQLMPGVPAVITVIVDRVAGTQTIRFNGSVASILTGFESVNVSAPWSFGLAATESFPLYGDCGPVLAAPSVLPPTDLAKVEGFLAIYGGITLPVLSGTIIVVDGDSIAYGAGGIDPYTGWPADLVDIYGAPIQLYNRAIPQRTLLQITTDQFGGQLPFSGAVNVLAAGTNDIAQDGATAVQLITYMQTAVSQVQGRGQKAVVSTILPRSSFDITQEGYRVAFNTAVNNGTVPSDAVADTSAVFPDYHVFPDGTHPDSAQMAVIAPILKTAILAAL